MIWRDPRLIELATVHGVSAGNCNAGDMFSVDDCSSGGGAQTQCAVGPIVGSSGAWCWDGAGESDW